LRDGVGLVSGFVYAGVSTRPGRVGERVSVERLGNAPPREHVEQQVNGGPAPPRATADASSDLAWGVVPRDDEAFAFVRFCYRRRAVAWPELYDEMCAVAARGDYRGMGYEQLEDLGIRFALAALPRLAEMAARVIAEERGRPPSVAAA